MRMHWPTGILARVPGLLRAEASLALACLVGLVLRVHHLRDQILVGDEWHALHKTAEAGFAGIFTSFGVSDHSIPVSAYYELAAMTVGLTDVVVRAPFLAAGMAQVLVLPLLVRHGAGKALSDAWAWFLATSPLLVFYSRFARPYAVSTTFSVLALFAFMAWWRDRRRAQAVLYAGSVLIAGGCLVIALPFALAPFPFHLARLARARGESARRDVRALLGLAAMTAVPLALVLGPAVSGDSRALTAKVGSGFGAGEHATTLLSMLAGVDGAWNVVVLGVGIAGALRLRQRAPAWLPLVLAAAALQLLCVVLLSPGHPITFARYALPALPILLLLPAAGTLALSERLPPRVSRVAGVALAPFVAALPLLAGPLRVLAHGPDNWTANHLHFAIGDRRSGVEVRIRRVPEFYRELARLPERSVTLIEAPLVVPMALNPLPYYQRIHRQRTRIGLVNGLGAEQRRYGEMPHDFPRLESRNFVYLADLVRMRAPPGDYVVLHRDLGTEVAVETAPLLATVVPLIALDPEPVIAALRARFGAPVHEDESITVFALRGGR